MISGIVILILRVLLAVCLYGFIGWVLYTIWQQLHNTGQTLLNKKAPLLTLVVEEPAHFSREFTSPELVLGRDPNCEFSLPFDETISSHHTRLSYHHGQWWVEDLDSTNGTFLNGEKVAIPTVIISGDEIGLGGLKISITIKTS
jgi:pSer/pThr/pTyr-binding forkhead associated (FHA) protein